MLRLCNVATDALQEYGRPYGGEYEGGSGGGSGRFQEGYGRPQQEVSHHCRMNLASCNDTEGWTRHNEVEPGQGKVFLNAKWVHSTAKDQTQNRAAGLVTILLA